MPFPSRKPLSWRAPAVLALAVFGLGGCEQIDPLTRPYSWVPGNANAHNIAAMAARPADLIQGRHASGRGAREDATSVERVATDKPKVLSGGGGGGGASAGGASAGGGS